MVPKASLATPPSSSTSAAAEAVSFLLGATCLLAIVSVVPAESSHLAHPPVPSHHVGGDSVVPAESSHLAHPPVPSHHVGGDRLLSLVSAFRGGVAAPGRLHALHYRRGSNPRLFRDFFTGIGDRHALDFR